MYAFFMISEVKSIRKNMIIAQCALKKNVKSYDCLCPEQTWHLKIHTYANYLDSEVRFITNQWI